MTPVIPPVPQELREPVQSLIRAASIMSQVLAAALQEAAASEGELPGIFSDEIETIKLAEEVIAAWRTHFGMDDDSN